MGWAAVLLAAGAVFSFSRAVAQVHNTTVVARPATRPAAKVVRVTTIQEVEFSDGTILRESLNCVTMPAGWTAAK